MLLSTGGPDPYPLSEFNPGHIVINANNGNYNLTGKTPRALDLTKNNCVLVAFGESLASNVSPTAYTPINANVNNFCIYNGGLYSAVDPVLGCSNAAPPLGPGNLYTRLVDSVQGLGLFDTTILVSAGVGGTQISQWAVDLFSRIKTTFARLAAAKLTATAVFMHIGANDSAGGTSQTAYASSQNAFIALVRLYYAGPIFIVKDSWYAGVVSPGIIAAQTAVLNPSLGIYAGGNGDTINAAGRQSDNIHFNDSGAATMASLNLSALLTYGSPF